MAEEEIRPGELNQRMQNYDGLEFWSEVVTEIPEGSRTKAVVLDSGNKPVANKNAVAEINTIVKANPEKSSSGALVSDTLMEKYSDLDNIKFGNKSVDKWEDKNLLKMDHLDLGYMRELKQDKRVEICEVAMSTLTESVSAHSVGAMLMCAWCLRSSEDPTAYCFKALPKMLIAPKPITALEVRVIAKAETETAIRYSVQTHGTKEDFERSASYICASVLRVLTKDENSYVNAWESICSNYRNFYRSEISTFPKPDLKCVSIIRRMLQNRTHLTGTVGIFLLAYQSLLGQDSGMCRMLYEMHVAYTGMHCYRLMLQCTNKLKVPSHIFLPLLRHRMTSDALDTIEIILTRYEAPNGKEAKEHAAKAKTWRYARAFNPDVFANIQKKNCQMFTALLATIAKELGTPWTGDVPQFSGVMAEWLQTRAKKIIDYCVSRAWEDPEA